MMETRAEAYYWEPAFDEAGKLVGRDVLLTIWEGNPNDRRGQRIVGTSIVRVEFQVNTAKVARNVAQSRLTAKVGELVNSVAGVKMEFHRRVFE